MKSTVRFIDIKLKRAFDELKDMNLRKWINKAMDDIEENAFCATQIRKNLIPKEYLKYGIDNLWKYDMPKGWRLLYSVGQKELIVVAVILEWLSHKDYERRFRY